MTSDQDPSNSGKPSAVTGESASFDLKALREAKGLSLRDIYSRTRVSVVNLEAIETGQFHRLPSPAYAKTFIRAYADAVGVDGDVLLGDYHRYLQSLNVAEELEKDRKRTTRKSRNRRSLFIGCFLMFILVAVGFLLSFSVQQQIGPETLRGAAPEPLKQKADEEAADAAKSAAPPGPAQGADQNRPAGTVQDGPVATLTVPPQPGGTVGAGAPMATPAPGSETVAPPENRQATVAARTYHLIVEARELTWIRIKADHHPPSELILNPGQRIERFAAERLDVDVGNAAGIELTFQGRSLGSLGKRGQVVHLSLPTSNR